AYRLPSIQSRSQHLESGHLACLRHLLLVDRRAWSGSKCSFGEKRIDAERHMGGSDSGICVVGVELNDNHRIRVLCRNRPARSRTASRRGSRNTVGFSRSSAVYRQDHATAFAEKAASEPSILSPSTAKEGDNLGYNSRPSFRTERLQCSIGSSS